MRADMARQAGLAEDGGSAAGTMAGARPAPRQRVGGLRAGAVAGARLPPGQRTEHHARRDVDTLPQQTLP